MSNDTSLATEGLAVKRRRLHVNSWRAIAACTARSWRGGAEISARVERHRAAVEHDHAHLRTWR